MNIFWISFEALLQVNNYLPQKFNFVSQNF